MWNSFVANGAPKKGLEKHAPQPHSGRETERCGALLKLPFADVRPEEWTPSYAGNASRIDFVLKPEQVAVEAKMTRNNLGQKEIINQLAIDILRYQAHHDCKTLICFVYDPNGKCNNPTALENDLTKNHGNLNVIVIVRPKHQ
jgi:hypothetical protein